MTPELVLNQDLFYLFSTVLALAVAAYKQHQTSTARKQTTAVIDYLDPAKPEANTAPAAVTDRFGTAIPTIAADGLTVGDLEVVGLYREWKRYEPQHQVPLCGTLHTGDKISVPIKGLRPGNAYVGLKVDDTIYDTKHFDIRSDMLGHPLEIWFTMPQVPPGTHRVCVVEGYKTNTMSYDTDPCWFDESATYGIEVRSRFTQEA